MGKADFEIREVLREPIMNSIFIYRKDFLKLFLPIFFSGFLIAYSISFQNYIYLIIPLALISFLFIKKNIIPFFVLLFLAFIGQGLVEFNLWPPQAIWLVEIIIYFLFLRAILEKTIKKEKIKLNFFRIILLFLAISFISLIANKISFIHFLLFLRLTLRYYLLFLAAINLDLNEKLFKTIINILTFLFIIQIPVATIRLFIFRQGETAVGTYAYHEGIYSTLIPLIAISFLVAYYFIYKQSNYYILLVFGFICFGLIGGKRALIIYVPLLFVFLGFFLRSFRRIKFKYIFIGVGIVILTVIFSVKYIPSLNPQHRYRGETNLKYLTDFVWKYNVMQSEDGVSQGRISTTINVFNILKERGFIHILVGLGPGSYIETMFKSLKTTLKESGKLPIGYGVTSLSWLAIQVGYFGALVYLFLFLYILKNIYKIYKLESRPYWKAFFLGMIGFSFIMLTISFSYGPIIADDMITLMFFLLVAFILKLSDLKTLSQYSSCSRWQK